MVSEMIGVAGMDFVIYDQEHGPLTAETTLKLTASAQNKDLAPIVRVRENREAEIQRALDLGAACRFHRSRRDQTPKRQSKRPVLTHSEVGDSRSTFVPVSIPEARATQEQNEERLLVIQVEGKRGVENIDEILEVEGIDVVFLGPYDLSQSLGIPGEVTHERVEKLMQRVCESGVETDTIVGAFADNAEIANKWINAGVQYLTVGVEAAHFTKYLENLVEDIDIPSTG
ncbi:HpcH/HpaI aldolase/citrate lyase family protein [Haladaptatus pallidirubidus]|uniref:HpcH/HpaI aldolase family protein n=1 Tax=Haladaptatus pallidirubidus TaxID=1008152 RepID=UPI0035E704DC